MAVLLDTHAFLWWCEDSPELSERARTVISSEDCFVSLASFWEIAIKVNLGKLQLPQTVERYIPDQMSLNGFDTLEIGFRAVAKCASLPVHHRDPFDRLLVAQAMQDGLPIVSRDPNLGSYGVERVW